MTIHKNTKLLPHQRQSMYGQWLAGRSIVSLSAQYDISRPTVYKWLKRAKLNEFANRLSYNHRFKTIQYGLKKLTKVEKKILKQLERDNIERYEKDYPGEMVHFDNAKLPAIAGDPNKRKEYLHVAVDDYSRYLVADIFPDKTQYSAAIHLEETIMAMPFTLETIYSDNGKEYKGGADHQFMATARDYNLKQSFTKVKTPKTNGKAERVIRTLREEWHRKHQFRSREERKRLLDQFVYYYNHQRQHQGLNGQTPKQRLDSYVSKAVKEQVKM